MSFEYSKFVMSKSNWSVTRRVFTGQFFRLLPVWESWRIAADTASETCRSSPETPYYAAPPGIPPRFCDSRGQSAACASPFPARKTAVLEKISSMV